MYHNDDVENSNTLEDVYSFTRLYFTDKSANSVAPKFMCIKNYESDMLPNLEIITRTYLSTAV